MFVSVDSRSETGCVSNQGTIKRPKMRITIRVILTLVTLGVLVPYLALVLWSNGKTHTMPRTVEKMEISSPYAEQKEGTMRDQWYEPHQAYHADIFRAHPIQPRVQQPAEKPWRLETPRPLPKESPVHLQKDAPKPLYRETSKSVSKEAPKLVKLVPRETPKPVPWQPPRPWAIESQKSLPVETSKAKSKPVVVKDPQLEVKDKVVEGEGRPRDMFRSKWWKQHLRQACHDLKMVESPQTLAPDMLQNVLVDDTNKLLFCQIPKVASTTWRRVFLQLTGKVDVSDFLQIPANDIHHKYDEHLTYLSEFSPGGISHRLRTYFKFMFVREPFERVLSAYKNKFLTKTVSAEYFKWKFGRKIIAKYRKPWLVPANNTGHGVTFEEFVTYLVDEKRKIMMNEHWELFHKLCHPCLIDYDFVGHLERIDEDSQYILDSNSLSDRIKVPSRKESRYGHRKTNSFMKEFYSKLPPSAISRLYQMYKADFLLFNYTIPVDVEPYM